MDESIKASPLDTTPVPPPSDPKVVMRPNLSLRPLYLTLAAIAFVLVGAGGYAAYQEYKAPPSISSYETCVQARGSRIQESYPATCVTRDGRQFTQPLTKNEQRNLVPPDETSKWKTYTNTVRGYTINYPPDWTIDATHAETPLEDAGGATLIIQKGAYKLTILWPAAFGPGICLFDDQSRVGTSEMTQFCEGPYMEFRSTDGKNIYRRLSEPDRQTNQVRWEVYTKTRESSWATLPPIQYAGPGIYDASTIQLMDTMLASYTAI